MSHHIAFRSIQMSHRQAGVGSFVDCLVHCLGGDLSPDLLRTVMRRSQTRDLSTSTLAERVGQLLCMDLNPVGQAIRLARNEDTFHKLWDFYNDGGNVIAKIAYSGIKDEKTVEAIRRSQNSQVTHEERMNEAGSHEKMLDAYQTALARLLRINQDSNSWSNAVEDNRVSTVARIFAAGDLVIELSEFFETNPLARVSDAYRGLGVHPRTVERRMRELGLSTVMLKRACMLARATHDLLWSGQSFTDVARRRGYADAAHLSRVISTATGGMTPSMVRGLACTGQT